MEVGSLRGGLKLRLRLQQRVSYGYYSYGYYLLPL